MKKLKWIATLLVMVCVLLGVIGCKDPEIEDTPTKKYGTVKGKAYYSNENVEDHSGIQITLVSTDGLRSVAYCESRGIATNSRSVSDIKTTAKDGSYSFENIPVGTYTIWASSRNSVEEAIETNVNVKANEVVTANDLNLVATGNVKGTITIDGKTDETLGLDVFIAGTSYVAKVGPTGNYEISKVPASKGYMLCVQKGEYTTIINEDLEVKAKETIEVGSKNLLSKDWETDNETQTNPTFKWLGEFATEPENPDLYDAYYNTTDGCSYIWNGSDWDLLAKSGEDGADGEDGKDGADGAAGADGQSIVWKGELEVAPENPELYWAYYNTTDGCSYIWNGNEWDMLAKFGADGEDGKDGADGAAGADGQSIVWKGELEVAPENPELYWAYYNINTGCSYIWNGIDWDLLTQHAHTYEWTIDSSGHWYECVCGAKKDESEHNFGIWKVTTEPTATTEGTSKRVCDICNFEETKQIIPVPEGFVLLEAGTFQMGSTAGDPNEKPVHEVTLTKNFYMSKYEVTQGEYEKYCTYGGSSPSSSNGDGNSYPAYCVSWYDALVYCNKRSMAEGLTPCYSINDSTNPEEWGEIPPDWDDSLCDTWDAATCDFKANGYRLPTEAEWEYAARAGDTTVDKLTYSGTSDVNELGDYAWLFEIFNQTTHEVGTKKANAFGLYDMSGNVSEWCWNWITDEYDTTTEGGKDPTGALSGYLRVRRGGCWLEDLDCCSVSLRRNSNPFIRSYVGFRVVRSSTDEGSKIHVHTFAEAWTSDSSGHWHAATCEHTEEISDYAKHSFGEYVSNNDATTEKDGTKIRECSVCGCEDTVTDEGSKIENGSTTPEGFVLIPAGTFKMGSNDGYDDNKPVHEVTITKDFYMGKYEVTQAEYEKYCSYGEDEPNSEYGEGANYPAYYVSWYDALVYCNKRSMAEGLTPCYSINDSTNPEEWGELPTAWDAATCDFKANGYRLPTEAEWEYAARAGDNTVDSLTYSGTSDVNELSEYAWYSDSSNDNTHEVGTKLPNAFGLYDMSGNVWEWCWNWFTDSYDAETEGGSDPTGSSAGSERVYRGGGWNSYSVGCAVSYRYCVFPSNHGYGLGLRVVRSAN